MGVRQLQPHFSLAKITRKLAILCLAFWLLPAAAVAKPTTADQARRTVQHWLARDGRPLGARLGQAVAEVQAFQDERKKTDYYVVYLAPGGFVVVPGDDLVEPIIAFAPTGRYDPSPHNPLGAMVSRDVPQRVARARKTEAQAGIEKGPFRPYGTQEKAWKKWQSLASAEEQSPGLETGLPSVSDPRVDPLVGSRWSQETVEGLACYNYYTPPNDEGSADNYPCGCPATAMAQLMRYFSFPTVAVGTPSFTIKVNGEEREEALRGGNGSGGAYSWSDMVLIPDGSITPEQRQAIGALTHDAGTTLNTEYAAAGSGAHTEDIARALKNPFTYTNAIAGVASDTIPLTSLIPMINPNLDASLPVVLGVAKTGVEGGHVIVADGYGYNLATLYHHLNMGWAGTDDAWYNLPVIDLTPPEDYNLVGECVYNVYTSGTGEIISGRVVDAKGVPLIGVKVQATYSQGEFTAYTNSRGIYSLPKMPSAAAYTVRVNKPGYTFAPRVVTTGTSANGSGAPGNLWGINFAPVAPVGIYELLL